MVTPTTFWTRGQRFTADIYRWHSAVMSSSDSVRHPLFSIVFVQHRPYHLFSHARPALGIWNGSEIQTLDALTAVTVCRPTVAKFNKG